MIQQGARFSRRQISGASVTNRCCQRQTTILLSVVWRMIATVPSPSAMANDPGAPDMLLWAVAVRHDGFEAFTFSGSHFYDDPSAHRHRPDSHVNSPMGIHFRNRPSPSIHYPLGEVGNPYAAGGRCVNCSIRCREDSAFAPVIARAR